MTFTVGWYAGYKDCYKRTSGQYHVCNCEDNDVYSSDSSSDSEDEQERSKGKPANKFVEKLEDKLEDAKKPLTQDETDFLKQMSRVGHLTLNFRTTPGKYATNNDLDRIQHSRLYREKDKKRLIYCLKKMLIGQDCISAGNTLTTDYGYNCYVRQTGTGHLLRKAYSKMYDGCSLYNARTIFCTVDDSDIITDVALDECDSKKCQWVNMPDMLGIEEIKRRTI
jgi:hypothetical protein